MTLMLPPELERFVQEKLRQGAFSDASEVLLESLRLWRDQEQQEKAAEEQLKQVIEERWEESGPDDTMEWTEEVKAGIRKRGMRRLEEMKRQQQGE